MNRRRPSESARDRARTRPAEPRVCGNHTWAMAAAVRDEARRLQWEVHPPTGGDLPRSGKPTA